MGVRVGINGFGRIGRNFFRAAQKQGADIELVAVNDLGDAKTMAHLLKYDSVLGPLSAKISADAESLTVNGKKIKVLKVKEGPAKMPWMGAVSLGRGGGGS